MRVLVDRLDEDDVPAPIGLDLPGDSPNGKRLDFSSSPRMIMVETPKLASTPTTLSLW